MGLFGKKKTSDVLIKSFRNSEISYKLENNILSFEFPIQSTILYPYLSIDENSNELPIIINIKKSDLKDLEKINTFNNNSRYFKASIKDGLLYLSYVLFMSDNVFDDLNRALGSLKALIDEIKNF